MIKIMVKLNKIILLEELKKEIRLLIISSLLKDQIKHFNESENIIEYEKFQK